MSGDHIYILLCMAMLYGAWEIKRRIHRVKLKRLLELSVPWPDKPEGKTDHDLTVRTLIKAYCDLNTKVEDLETYVRERASAARDYEMMYDLSRSALAAKTAVVDELNFIQHAQAATIERLIKWISVDDNLPEPWVPVIVYDAAWHCRYIAMFDDEEKEWSATSDREPPQEITYWRNMPDFPVDAALNKQEPK